MTLTSGTRLGPYEILSPIGAGGMGEVYRARDTALGRDIALKVLPESVAQDSERVSRFEREAQLLASLNHPNVATLFGFESDGDVRFLVMEFVEGEDLASRLRSRPIPVDTAVSWFIQIADGLEAAHAKGIVHRDLKPANLKVSDDGRVKILDFGLAKPMAPTPGADLSESPTRGVEGTSAGTVLGTGPYMSPEQAMGKAIDRQTDVWAYGCCLFEALTGKRAFDGDTLPEIIVNINKKELDWELLPSDTPERVRRILRRCLTKSTHERLHDIADARVELQDEPTAGLGGAEKPDRRLLLTGALSAIAVFAAWTFGRDPVMSIFQGPPVVILMDTLAPRGVYDAGTRSNSGTNADDLNHELRSLPIVLQKETLGPTWDREDQILKQQPALIVIHRSAFLHSMNLEFGYGDAPFPNEDVEQNYRRLRAIADNKTHAFFGYVGLANPTTRFLVYSRGWKQEASRREWVSEVVTRFPYLDGRVTTMLVPSDTEENASFRDPETAKIVRQHVESILGLETSE